MTNILNFPILSLVIFVPLVGALLIMFFFNRRQPTAIKYFAFFVTLLDFVISVPLIIYFQKGTAEMQFVENLPWIPSIGATYFLGIDGISIFLVLLTTFLSAIAVLSSFAAISDREKEYYVSLMILETGMLGVFTSLDFFLFYIFWEIVLVPMYFLIGVWGNPAPLCGHQVLPLHAFRQRGDAAGNPGHLLLSCEPDRGLHVQRA